MIKIKFVDGIQPLEIDAGTISAAVQYAVENRLSLRLANLSGADLRWADLSGADLRDADLSGADLRGADLSVADLRDADLSGADLSGADLRDADLRWADLSGADLRDADLSGADLRGADLSVADLRDADLSGADLSGADLRDADLRDADLRGANIDFSCWPLRCGSLNVKIDKRIFCQLLYHTLRAGKSVDYPEVNRLFEIPEVVNLANQFHRVDECGKIEVQNGKNWGY